MSSHDHSDRRSCADFSNLLLPFVDSELAEEDSHGLLDHLERCPDCTQVVQEQQCVRAMLSQIPQSSPPAGLRERVSLALDAVDAEREAKAASEPAAARSSIALWPAKLRAMLRGAFVMVPATAAAALLWVSLRPTTETAADADSELSTLLASNSAPSLDLKAADLPPSLPPPILGARGLPKDFEFVSAKPNVVHYRHARRNFQLFDQRQALHAPLPSSAKIFHHRGEAFVLSRDPQGRAHLFFTLGTHTHRLTLVRAAAHAPPQGQLSAQDPDFAEMLSFARALKQSIQIP